jgi:hypothetical protein
MISTASVFSQIMDGVPHLISYQGRLTDSVGNPVTDGEYVVTFTIWSDSTSISPTDREWISPSCTLLVVNGLFNWQLGSRESLPPWTITNDVDLWLGIQVESDAEITPRTRLCSAPYAYKAWQADYAEYADSAGALATGAGLFPGVETGKVLATTKKSPPWPEYEVGQATIVFDTSFAVPPAVFVNVVLRQLWTSLGDDSLRIGDVASADVVTYADSCVVTARHQAGGTPLEDTYVELQYIAIEQ